MKLRKSFFKKYKKADDYIQNSQGALEEIIRSTGFFRQKAKNIRRTMSILAENYGGKVPKDMDTLVQLPGIGRKTANVVLGNSYGIPGIPVDTHVGRVTQRLGLTKNFDPVKIEYDLNELIPKKEWVQLSHTLIFHGRQICKARKPLCNECPVAELCDYYQKEVQGR